MKAGLASIAALAAVLVAAAPAARAQQVAPDSRLMFDPGALSVETSGRAVATPKADAKRAPKPKPRAAEAAPPLKLDPIDGTAPSSRRIRIQKPKPVAEKDAGFGRVPFEAGSFGFESDTKLKTSEMPDGSRTRGWDKGLKTANSPSYFGLSLTVPTDSRTFAPLLPRPD